MPQSQPVRLLLLAVAFIGLAPVLAAAAPGEPGAPEQPPGPVRLGAVGAGSLLFRTEAEGLYLPAPLVRTDVRMDASGMINRVTVSQRFYNPTDKWLEAVYVFPLPEGAAVDHLRLRVGERLIEGKIKKREEAKKIYDRAKAAGRKASLIEQERPNIFTNSVANIGPGEDVVVQIEYQESLRYDRGGFSLRFPMVVGPRFIPGSGPVSLVSTGTGWAANNGRVPDADRITPPVLDPARGKTNPVTIEIALDPGFAIARIASPSHKIAVREDGAGGRLITLVAGPVPADRDFVLEWQPETGAEPSAGLFTETVEGTDYALIMLMPPVARQPGFDLPREVIYVIDTSGSMGGASIRQAREALLLALARLRPRDSFNVIQFSDITSALFPQARRAETTAVEAARRYVRDLVAEGGTNMLPALVRALDTGGAEEAGRLRQVIFLTDGAIGNEAELFREVKSRLGRSRLFTVGIGSAPNSYFMTRAARYGRGTFTHIGDLAEVKERMAALFAKLEAPVLTDIAVEFPDRTNAETWPRIVPDLYQGEPVVVAARLASGVAGGGRAVITGLAGGQPWRVEMQLGIGREGQGVGALWARRKIAALMEKLHEGESLDDIKPRVVEVALAHHLVSRYTSLVAVDLTRSRPEGEDIETGAVATNLPQGWDYDKVFGAPTGPRRQWQMKRKARATGAGAVFAQAAPVSAPDRMVALKTAAAPVAAGASAPGQVLQQLPKGATPALLKLLIGFAALLLAAIAASWPRWPRIWRGMWWARRRSFS